MHVPSEIVAEEAEEIGVEHLLRDIKDNAVGTLSTRITSQLGSLGGLQGRLGEIRNYLTKVLNNELLVNHQIIYNLQDMFNLLPNLENRDMINSFSTKTNDQLLLIYSSSMIRSVIALHNLIDNKIDNLKSETALESSEEKEVKELEIDSTTTEKNTTEKSDDMQIE